MSFRQLFVSAISLFGRSFPIMQFRRIGVIHIANGMLGNYRCYFFNPRPFKAPYSMA